MRRNNWIVYPILELDYRIDYYLYIVDQVDLCSNNIIVIYEYVQG